VHVHLCNCSALLLLLLLALQIKLWRPLYPDNPILETSSKFEVLQVGVLTSLSGGIVTIQAYGYS
jgi:hypothetical protein